MEFQNIDAMLAKITPAQKIANHHAVGVAEATTLEEVVRLLATGEYLAVTASADANLVGLIKIA